LRLRIATVKSLQPKLPEAAQKCFQRFARLANVRSLHPTDWRRFYAFVRKLRHAERYRQDEMRWLLIQAGFPHQQADHIAAVFEHLAAFKIAKL
jgi:hypothetical protein